MLKISECCSFCTMYTESLIHIVVISSFEAFITSTNTYTYTGSLSIVINAGPFVIRMTYHHHLSLTYPILKYLISKMKRQMVSYILHSQIITVVNKGNISCPKYHPSHVCLLPDIFRTLQSSTEIIETTAKNGVIPVATSNLKLFLKTIWWGSR